MWMLSWSIAERFKIVEAGKISLTPHIAKHSYVLFLNLGCEVKPWWRHTSCTYDHIANYLAAIALLEFLKILKSSQDNIGRALVTWAIWILGNGLVKLSVCKYFLFWDEIPTRTRDHFSSETLVFGADACVTPQKLGGRSSSQPGRKLELIFTWFFTTLEAPLLNLVLLKCGSECVVWRRTTEQLIFETGSAVHRPPSGVQPKDLVY